ncbi:hypothetical protein IGI04_023276 [Brassica rapa subsp. trilocularis]|uniref:Uncharacterized protein n=1 Tax=Brassica rapa subsp. trilocularis TaxID=1813537 RepID=A0ABQ7M5K2_BRACM|nr:hypothetical protein IGI04_023276 [Brassica rapa subsp. trilocularis]
MEPNKHSNSPNGRVGPNALSNSPIGQVGPNAPSNSSRRAIRRRGNELDAFRRTSTDQSLVLYRLELPLELYNKSCKDSLSRMKFMCEFRFPQLLIPIFLVVQVPSSSKRFHQEGLFHLLASSGTDVPTTSGTLRP